jgi:hypothetical protein
MEKTKTRPRYLFLRLNAIPQLYHKEVTRRRDRKHWREYPEIISKSKNISLGQ